MTPFFDKNTSKNTRNRQEPGICGLTRHNAAEKNIRETQISKEPETAADGAIPAQDPGRKSKRYPVNPACILTGPADRFCTNVQTHFNTPAGRRIRNCLLIMDNCRIRTPA